MKNSCRLILISFLALAVVACDGTDDVVRPPIPPGALAYTGFDEQGAALVNGWVKLDIAIIAADSTVPSNVTGSWKLWRVRSDGEVGPQIGEGVLEGLLQEGSLFVNFNPTQSDDNVVADGTFELTGNPPSGMRWEGTWTWNTFAGPRRTGAFRARS